MSSDVEKMRQLIHYTKKNALKYHSFTGCFIYKDSELIAQSMTSIMNDRNCLAHAEMNSIQLALNKLNSENLADCTLFTTQKPCMMCASAIVWAKIEKVYFGINSNHHWKESDEIHTFFSRHRIKCEGPFLENECIEIDKLLRSQGI